MSEFRLQGIRTVNAIPVSSLFSIATVVVIVNALSSDASQLGDFQEEALREGPRETSYLEHFFARLWQ